MATYYVNSGAGGADTGGSWTNAFLTFAQGVTAATTAGDIIKVHKTHSETLSATKTYTLVDKVIVICVDKDNSDIPSTGALISGGTVSSFSLILNGSFFMHGVELRTSTTAYSSGVLRFCTDGDDAVVLSSCVLSALYGGYSQGIRLGAVDSQGRRSIILYNCTLKFGATDGVVGNGCANLYFYNCVMSGGSAHPSTYLIPFSRGGVTRFEACDFSGVSGTLVDYAIGPTITTFSNCKFHSGVVVQASINVKGQETFVYNCSSGDNHYFMGHYDHCGSTIVDTGIYANDGASYDGTNRCSWKIVTTANCNRYNFYISPWIDCYHSGASAITPSLEIVRSGSATAYQDDEVWGEFSYQGTSGSPLGVIVNDAVGVGGTPANQTTGVLDASGWTGENATSWFGKLNPTSTITPAEIGHLRARVCVGEPSITVYVDPTIRGRS